MGSMFGTLAKHYSEGGWMMHPILVALIFTLAVMIDRIIVLYFKAAVDKESFLRGLKQHVFAGDLDKAIAFCAAQKKVPLVSVIKAGLINVPKGEEDVQAAMDEATLRESPKIEARTGYLAMLGNVATLLGLLGTIVGLIGAFGAVANANPAAVYRSVNNPYVDRYVRHLRRDLYPGGLFGRGKVEGDHGDNQRTARVLTDFVRSGGRLGLVCDLYDRSGVAVPFFDKPARTQAIGAMIARRVGSRMWMSCCRRVGRESRFVVEIKELRVPRTGNQAEDIRWIMTEMQLQFEEWVRESPEQWMWSNRRWS